MPVQERLSSEEIGYRLVRPAFGQYFFKKLKRQIPTAR
jgi:hypothetical protein